MIGACLLLEYGVSGAAVGVGWGEYLNELLFQICHWRLPDIIARPPGDGGVVNLPAAALVALCMLLLLRGVRESSAVNAVLVAAKLAVLGLFVVIALKGFSAHNLHPFAPLGLKGIGAAASSIFFSYIGIDVVATASEEVKNPRRTLPLGIIFSLLIVTGVYILVAFAAVGAQPWTAFAGQEAGLAVIVSHLSGAAWPAAVLSIGAIISIFSVTLVVLYSQTRILFAMSRDGLIPAFFRRVHPRTRAPSANTWLIGCSVGVMAAVVPPRRAGEPDQHGHAHRLCDGVGGASSCCAKAGPICRGATASRSIRPCPWRASVFCLYLIAGLPWNTYALFAVWLAAACLIYFGYSVHRSALAGAAQRLQSSKLLTVSTPPSSPPAGDFYGS